MYWMWDDVNLVSEMWEKSLRERFACLCLGVFGSSTHELWIQLDFIAWPSVPILITTHKLMTLNDHCLVTQESTSSRLFLLAIVRFARRVCSQVCTAWLCWPWSRPCMQYAKMLCQQAQTLKEIPVLNPPRKSKKSWNDLSCFMLFHHSLCVFLQGDPILCRGLLHSSGRCLCCSCHAEASRCRECFIPQRWLCRGSGWTHLILSYSHNNRFERISIFSFSYFASWASEHFNDSIVDPQRHCWGPSDVAVCKTVACTAFAASGVRNRCGIRSSIQIISRAAFKCWQQVLTNLSHHQQLFTLVYLFAIVQVVIREQNH